ncbi:lipoxygenase homology domain-containing protein 1-like [Antedon mediterranea]|uniref:lipoxygenase homology domain-containing protein 1-like n=1 Tax=Antedon mediterranea TaxID=105859 RepID=UPI003AF7CA4C
MMWGPYTNSEAVQDCLSMTSSYAPQHVHTMEPRPPYAVGKPRPFSAPIRKQIAADRWRDSSSDHMSLSNQAFLQQQSIDSRYAYRPKHHAGRQYEVINRETQLRMMSYPRMENGKKVYLPSYSSLSDPHLTDYYARKFGLELRPPSAIAKRRALSAKTSNGFRPHRPGSAKNGETVYKIEVKTGDKKGCGTSANVFISMKGDKGKFQKKKLTKKQTKTNSGLVHCKFNRNSAKIFNLKGPEVGELKSLTIEHDGLEKKDSWFVDEVKVTNLHTKKSWLFFCSQWLSLFHNDCQISRNLRPVDAKKYGKTQYEIVVITGDVAGAGTDANVYITLFGARRSCSKFQLKGHGKMFERGKSDIFTHKCEAVGPLKKIRIEHDNTGFAAGWFLERVVVTDLKNPKKSKYYFPCSMWLARDEGDKLISRDLLGSKDPLAIRKSQKYMVHVFTGNKRKAGTDANVYLTLFGEGGDSGEHKLNTSKNNFEKGSEDIFVLECAGLGALDKLRIGHDNSGFGAAWFLDKIIVDDTSLNKTYKFPCNRWFAKDEDDGKISRELYCEGSGNGSRGTPYEVRVTTGDKRHAGTSAGVYIVMYGGENGEETSGKINLDGKFEKGRTDVCDLEIGNALSPLSRIDIGHDNCGSGAGWFLDRVVVSCPSSAIEQTFICDKWLADDEDDNVIERTLYENKSMRKTKKKKLAWNVTVFTSDIANSGTDANVSMCLYGSQGKTDDIELKTKSDVFEKGDEDNFKIEAADVGKLYKMRIWHDNSGLGPGWHLDKVVVEQVATRKKYTFNCQRWLATSEDDGEIIREIPAEGDGIKKPLKLLKYNVQIVTGDKFGAGTDANVFCNIFGELGDTGERPMKKSKTNRNKFERKAIDEFVLEAVSLQQLSRVRIGHDGAGAGAGWFLEKVIVREEGRSQSEVVFPCGRWLDRDEDDGQIVRELVPEGKPQLLSTTSYHVSVKTGDERGAGTDANVHIKLFGKDGDTGLLPLKQAENTKNKFERGRTDKFTLEAVDIGKIEYMKIGHDGSGPGAGWYLDSVEVDIPSRGEAYSFACHRWLAEDEEDGELEIEVTPTDFKKSKPRIPYEITVLTGEVSGAGTDSNVFVRLYGKDGAKTEEYKLRNRTDNFEKGNTDKFKIEAEDVGPLTKIRIGHDGVGMFSGWFLNRVIVERFPPKKKLKRSKSKSKIDASDDDDNKSKLKRRKSKSKLNDSEDEENDNRKLKRRKSKSSLKSESDEEETKGTLKRRKSKGKLDESEDENEKEEETTKYMFVCNRWLARGEDDGQIVRELVPTDENGKVLRRNSLVMSEYVVRVFTGDKFRGGTDANVFINIFGEKGDTGERRMKDSETHRNKFERNQEDVFKLEAADLGSLLKLKIRHDNSGTGASWFLDRVEVEDKRHNARYYFPCQRWLSTNDDDGQISRELVPLEKDVMNRLSKSKSTTSIRDELALETKAAMETYHVFVTTSDVRGAGTDANVYVIIFGENDDTGLINLKSSKTNKNKFERGVTDEFVVEAVHIGDIQKIRIGHDNKGGFAGWMLDKVVIDAPSLGKKWEFPCGRWLDKGEDDGQIERELFPITTRTEEYEKHVPYEITVYTSDVNGAGTDSDVFVVLFGMDTNTTQKSLCENKKQRKECFERKKVDKFVVELEDVGESIEKIRIGHDGSGFGAAWHLDKVEVRKLLEKGKGSRTFVFPCKRWFARKEDDGEIVRELVPAQVTEEKMGKDGTMKKKELKQSTLTMRKYKVLVYTGDVFRAGTDANVFINIFGENGDTGERKLLKSESYSDKFERAHCDKFSVEAVDLGKVFKIKIRHDNSGFNAAWFLDKVEVVDTDGETALFRCERWIGKNKDDGKLERSLYIKGYEGDTSSTATLSTLHRSASMRSLKSIKESPRSKSGMEEPVYDGPTIPYTVKITTGKEEDMGTTANAFINFIGPKKKNVTGKIPLHLVNKTKMEPASTETFSLEAPDITEIQKIEIGHDGVTPQEGWFIEEIEVDMPTVGKHYIFPCKCWFSKDKDDGKIVRTLFLEQGQKLQYKPKIPYEVTIYTGDVQAAGTDAPITMTVFGSNGNTPEIPIDKCGDRFERGSEDMIKMELDDIASLKKLRIGHNGKGSRADWYLEKVTMRNSVTGELTVFKCEDWLSKNQSDKKIVRDLPATIKGKQQIKNTTYIVNVKTGDVRGGGTDANVSIVVFGMNGDSGELKLKESTTHRDKFERNQMDVFKFDMLSLGELTKIRIWHDNAGFKAGWNLESVEVRDEKKDESYMFTVNRWLARDEDDKQIMREITCDNQLAPKDNKEKIVYEISVSTTDKRDAGTYQNAWIILQGDLRSSKEFLMENSPKEKILRKGDVNTFKFSTRNVGKIESILLGHKERPDGPRAKGTGRDVEWHCYEVIITDSGNGTKYVFPCNAWIPLGYDRDDAKHLVPKTVEEGRTTAVRNLAPVHYEVIVVTSDEKGAGTDANVSITIYGTNGDSGKQALKQKWRDLFEKGQTDKFKLEILDLGKLQKIRIEHDNAGFKNAAWLCDRVEIINTANNERTVFPCGKWLDKKKGDGELFKELFPQKS